MANFTMGGKKMVLNRGRWKESINVGSRSEGKGTTSKREYIKKELKGKKLNPGAIGYEIRRAKGKINAIKGKAKVGPTPIYKRPKPLVKK